jgi:hypothetical protein
VDREVPIQGGAHPIEVPVEPRRRSLGLAARDSPCAYS